MRVTASAFSYCCITGLYCAAACMAIIIGLSGPIIIGFIMV
jgi:hypothetical protein